MSVENNKACCNCRHNIRTTVDRRNIICNCDIDGHYIGYIECHEYWCRHWARNKKFDVQIEIYKQVLQDLTEAMESSKRCGYYLDAYEWLKIYLKERIGGDK